MTCRSEILNCAQEIYRNTGRNTFSIMDILDCMRRKRLKYEESTIRTHIVSWMCRNAPENLGTQRGELERVSRGLYRLFSSDNSGPLELKITQISSPSSLVRPISESIDGRAYLESFGFKRAGDWFLEEGQLNSRLNDLPNSDHGLYAFVLGDQVLYIGKTSNSLKRRLYSYRRPGPSQRTNIRANAMLTDLLKTHPQVDIYSWVDPGSENADGLFLDKAAGYETALIRKLLPPWNKMK